MQRLRRVRKVVIYSFTALFLLAYTDTQAGMRSVSKTNQLAPGMSTEQVRAILGEPKQTEFIADKWVWKYSLHQAWKGFIPYYLVFDKEKQVLQSWYADEAEYMRQQQLWLQAIPPKQEVEVTIKPK